MPTATSSSSSLPLVSSPGSSTSTASSHALSTPSSSNSPNISPLLVNVQSTGISTGSTTAGVVVNGSATLHKRAPPSSNPPPPARLHHMHNAYSSPSSSSSSTSPSTPQASNKLVKKEHPTLGSLQDVQPSSAHKHQANKLRKVMHNADYHKVAPSSSHDPDEVVLLPDSGPIPTDLNSPLPPTQYHTNASTKGPQRPEPVRQQSYSKRHASFDTPRTEVPLPFFSELFPRELERHQQHRCSESDEPTEPSPTRQSKGPALPILSTTATPSASQPRPPSPSPPLVRNNSAPTPPSSPLCATDVQDLKETESLRDRVERKEQDKETPWPSIDKTPSSEGSIGRRSTASLPLPGEHAGDPLHWFGAPPRTAGLFPTSSALHPLSSIPALAGTSSDPPRAFSMPPPPAPAAPEISTPPTTLHALLDIPASASSSASSIPALAHASSSAVSPQSSALTTTPASPPATSTSTTILNSPTLSQPTAATTIATGPQGPHMTVQTTSTAYILTTFLPGYQRDEITLSTRKRRVLHVVADPFLTSSRGTGHFERRISFGYDADMAHIRAEFNGGVLKIVVPRRPTMSAPAGYDSKIGLGGQEGNVWGS